MCIKAAVSKVGLSPFKKNCFIRFNERSLKIMKNAFYFIGKAFLGNLNFPLELLVVLKKTA